MRRDLAWVAAVRLLLQALHPIQLMHSDPVSFQDPALPGELCRSEVLRLDVGRLSVIDGVSGTTPSCCMRLSSDFLSCAMLISLDEQMGKSGQEVVNGGSRKGV